MMNPIDNLAVSPDDEAVADLYRRNHQTSILTICVVDIVGYTDLCEKLSELDVLENIRHFQELSHTLIETEGSGKVIKWIGDAVLAVFADPVSALLAMFKLRDNLRDRKLFEGTIELRIGVHTGLVAVEQEGFGYDVFGRQVNRAARVQAAAQPGEVLVTDVVEDNVWTWSRQNQTRIVFTNPRQLRLKGVDRPILVYTSTNVTNEENGQYERNLIDDLSSSNPIIRLAAIRLAGNRDIQAARSEIEKLLFEDSDPSIREASAWALGQLSNEKSQGALMHAIDDPCQNTRLATSWALVRLGIGVIPQVKIVAEQSSNPVLQQTARHIVEKIQKTSTRIQLTAHQDNILTRPADILLLMYAQPLNGLCEQICSHLQARGIVIRPYLPAPGKHYLYEGSMASLGADRILFVGVCAYDRLDYPDLERYSSDALSILARVVPEVKSIVTPTQFVLSLDKEQCFKSQADGLTYSMSQGIFPRDLERIEFVNHWNSRVETCNEILFDLTTEGLFPKENTN